MTRTNFNQFIYGRRNGKFAGGKKKEAVKAEKKEQPLPDFMKPID